MGICRIVLILVSEVCRCLDNSDIFSNARFDQGNPFAYDSGWREATQ